jgi:hypothetical protein
MNSAYQPVRTTLILGGLGGLAFLGAGVSGVGFGWWPWMALGIVWCLTAFYALALVRWSGRSLTAVLFPLLVLGGIGVVRPLAGSTFLLALGVISWIRSGVCYPRAPFQALFREMLLCGGGGLVLAFWNPTTPLAWALGIWLFSLLQALFFVLFEPAPLSADTPPPDSFDQARLRIEDLLRN